MNISSHKLSAYLSKMDWLIPFGVYLLHSLLLKDWIVDDAGISFSYAKNLAEGNGLVPQPDHPRVEGFSNPLWVFLLSPLFLLNLFHAVITPKIFASLFVAGTFWGIRKGLRLFEVRHKAAFWVSLLIAVNAPFVIWANSGLENSLYVFCIVWLFYFSVRFSRLGKFNTLFFCWLFLVFTAISRPEGLFWGSLSISCLLMLPSSEKSKKIWLFLASWILAGILILGVRLLYFEEWLPNTFYAKTGSSASYWPSSFSQLTNKLNYLSYSIGGNWAKYLVGFSALVFFLLSDFRRNKAIGMLFIWMVLAAGLFMLLPSDWMGELRFASIFIVVFYLYFISAYFQWSKNKNPILRSLLVVCFVLYSGYHFYKRTIQFSNNPTVPLNDIKTRYADPFSEYARRLNIPKASVFLPDVGAMYFFSDLKVYDAAGLCDAFIARNKNKPEVIRNYVLDSIKPSFVHLHGRWSLQAKLFEHPEFRKKYTPLFEYNDSLASGDKMSYFLSGDYVHKEFADSSRSVELKRISYERKSTFTF